MKSWTWLKAMGCGSRKTWFSHQCVLWHRYVLGDKRRMVDWRRPDFLERIIGAEEVEFIHGMVPETHLLAEWDREAVWRARKAWVFKPAARHGGKGVLPGRAMSRKRFAELDADTVMQHYVPASRIERSGMEFRLDIRLFTHGPHLIALAGRIWQGKATNFRAAGSGWAPLRIVG